jgi:hypothetical protein
MAKIERSYQRTDAGRKAWEKQDSGLPAEYRRILGLLQTQIHSDAIRAALRRYSDEQIVAWLTELESLGLVVSEALSAKHDLDFTGSFKLSSALAAHKDAAKKD